MLPDRIVTVHEKTDVSAARRAAMETASGLGEEQAGALNLVVTEAATNLIKHAGGGRIILRRGDFGYGPNVDVIAIDKGPGISNPARCFDDGYSTAGSPGTGLGAVRRLASFCDYYSAAGKGTVLMARVGQGVNTEKNSGVEVGAVGSAYPGEEISGDSWAAQCCNETCRMILADGLGHGVLASEASVAAVDTALASPKLNPERVLEQCHARLRPTRGAAVSLADADFAAATLSFAGVGNVAGSIVSESGERRQMVCANGTVGHEMRRTSQYSYPLPPDSLVVLHSDGLSTNWNLEKYPGLFHRDPSVIAAVLFRDFQRGRDDATVVIARARRSPSGRSPAL